MSKPSEKWESVREEMDAGRGITLSFRAIRVNGLNVIRMHDTEENEKFARLIAAAPDLLEACKMAQELLCCKIGREQHPHVDLVVLANKKLAVEKAIWAAIEKAEPSVVVGTIYGIDPRTDHT